MSTRDVHRRLQALELQLKPTPEDSVVITSSSSTTKNDLLSRLEALEQRATTNTSQQQNQQMTTMTLWQESQALWEPLQPGSALTYQQQVAAPLVYRQQEVLAHAPELQRDMKLVAQVQQYLLMDTTSTATTTANSSRPVSTGPHNTVMTGVGASSNKTGSWTPSTTTSTTATFLTEDAVLQAPIVCGPTYTTEDMHKWHELGTHVTTLQQQINTLSQRLDRLVEHYHTLIVATSEKLVQADEQLRQLGV
jgi:hypothetical protein